MTTVCSGGPCDIRDNSVAMTSDAWIYIDRYPNKSNKRLREHLEERSHVFAPLSLFLSLSRLRLCDLGVGPLAIAVPCLTKEIRLL